MHSMKKNIKHPAHNRNNWDTVTDNVFIKSFKDLLLKLPCLQNLQDVFLKN